MKIEATVREQKSNLGLFGKITSKDLAQYIGKDVIIDVKEKPAEVQA